MTSEGVKRKLTAIFSADVKGYSRLMREDEVATLDTLRAYRKTMSALIQKHRGRVVDTPGDNLLAEFGSVVDAVQCAVEVQQELKARNAELPENRRMEFRIGVNLGDVIDEEERIYGDGVNVAARVEGLADAGGICISGTAFDQVRTKLSVGYEYLGEQTVKNIPEPVRVYRVLMDPGAAGKVIGEKRPGLTRRQRVALAAALIVVIAALAIWYFHFRPSPMEVASVEKMAFPLPDKPSIAVLPFVNMSGDPEQEYIVDGITESIITALCKIPEMFVIARTSTSTYKGKSVKTQQVSEELGVRYVLEGSVQKTGDRIRVTAQLIDAIAGHHLWADRYDRGIEDFFALLDEIAKKVAIELQVKLTEGDTARMSHKTRNFEAWGYGLEAYGLLKRANKENVAKARELCEKAVKLDPGYGFAWGALGAAHAVDAMYGYTESPDKSFKLAVECIDRSLKLDETLSCSTAVKGRLHVMQGQFEQAIAVGEKAVALDPSADIPYILLSSTMGYAGRFEEAIALIKKAMRLNPCYPAYYLRLVAHNSFLAGRYEEALEANKQVLEYDKKGGYLSFFAHLGLSAVYIELGREEEARAHAAEVLKINPKFSLVNLRKRYSYYKDPAHSERLLSALRRAGLPETPPLPLPDKPSIAVLPFTNMSGDPKQEYFSDGITEEIITALSKAPNLFVIARHSTFAYKGKPLQIRQIAKELGVRYVLEGSFRKVEVRVRVTAQLIDAITGHHLWAERYDRELKDIFSVQDDVALKILTSLQVTLTEGEQARVFAKGTQNLEAYLKFVQAREHMIRLNKEDNALARRKCEEAIALDPQYASAYGLLSRTYVMNFAFRINPKEALKKAYEFAHKAISLDETQLNAHLAIEFMSSFRRQHEEAVASGERAVKVAPGSAEAYLSLGRALSFAGRDKEALGHLEKAIRMNPFPPSHYYLHLGFAHNNVGNYDEAISAFKKALALAPKSIPARLNLIVSYVQLGSMEDARTEAEEIVKIDPKYTTKGYGEKRSPWRDKAVIERQVEAWRKVGLERDVGTK